MLPLPAATDAIVPRTLRQGDNLGLWLDRFIRRPRRSWELKAANRLSALEAFAKRWESPAAHAALARRVLGHTGLVENKPMELAPGRWHLRFSMEQAGPMVVDYGRVHVLEASLSFDRLLGVPRIPGSALKGAARAAAESAALSAATRRDLFGEMGQAGAVCFLDALPEDGRFELAVDVLTPHFGPYYQGDSAPGDWLSPVPTTFLTVVGTTFVFDLDGPDPDQVEQAAGLLQRALVEQGVGAKTAAGYGWFGAPP